MVLETSVYTRHSTRERFIDRQFSFICDKSVPVFFCPDNIFTVILWFETTNLTSYWRANLNLVGVSPLIYFAVSSCFVGVLPKVSSCFQCSFHLKDGGTICRNHGNQGVTHSITQALFTLQIGSGCSQEPVAHCFLCFHTCDRILGTTLLLTCTVGYVRAFDWTWPSLCQYGVTVTPRTLCEVDCDSL
jgi:hypothetical protein